RGGAGNREPSAGRQARQRRGEELLPDAEGRLGSGRPARRTHPPRPERSERPLDLFVHRGRSALEGRGAQRRADRRAIAGAVDSPLEGPAASSSGAAGPEEENSRKARKARQGRKGKSSSKKKIYVSSRPATIVGRRKRSAGGP